MEMGKWDGGGSGRQEVMARVWGGAARLRGRPAGRGQTAKKKAPVTGCLFDEG